MYDKAESPEVDEQAEKTAATIKLYDRDGGVYLSIYTDGYWYDDAGNHYKEATGCDFMYVNDGECRVMMASIQRIEEE